MLYSISYNSAVPCFSILALLTQRKISLQFVCREISSTLFWLASTLLHCQNNYTVGLTCLLLTVIQECGCFHHMASLERHKILYIYSIYACVHWRHCLDFFDLFLNLFCWFVVYCSTSGVIYFWCVNYWLDFLIWL